MKVLEIYYTDYFKKQFLGLPEFIKKMACRKEKLFREDPFHPSLRLHKLRGRLDGSWSISVDMKYRIIFKPLGDGVILFGSIGTHAIYGI